MARIDRLCVPLERGIGEDTKAAIGQAIFKWERKWKDAKIQFSENRSIQKELRVQSQGGDQAAHRTEQST